MKEAVFTMKLEPELRNAFMAAAESAHRPASQVMRELMREYVQRQQAAQQPGACLHASAAGSPATRPRRPDPATAGNPYGPPYRPG